jgi:hypothetical protein
MNLQINEYQRKMFLQAVEHLVATQPELLKSQPADDTVVITEESMYEECKMMISMLKELPKTEEEIQASYMDFACKSTTKGPNGPVDFLTNLSIISYTN